MNEQTFIDAGFKLSDDPQYKFEYPLPLANTEEAYDCTPAILFDIISSQFCLFDGNNGFIKFNASTPLEAIEWANRITSFEFN